MTNEQRADRARQALAAYMEEDDLHQAVTDLLADALHLSRTDDTPLDISQAALMAEIHYNEELDSE